MTKPNTTEEAVVELKNTIKTEIINPAVLFCNKYISLRMKKILLIMAILFMFGLLVYSLFNM
jgi:hypothetical protein